VVVIMGRYVTVSVKIPVEVRDKLRKYGVKISELLKRAIYEELRRREVEEVERELRQLRHVLKGFSREFVVKALREDRESR